MGLLLAALGVGHGPRGNARRAAPKASRPGLLAAPAPGVPRLFSYGKTGTGARQFAVELPQADGSVRLARLEGCAAEQDVRQLFGLHQSPIRDLGDASSRLSEPSTLVLPCPDALPAGAPVFVEPQRQGASFLQWRAASAEPPVRESYLVIPNRCTGLVNHFHITERGFQRGASAAGQPPPEAERVALSCGAEPPGPSYAGWQVHWARNGDLALVLLRKQGVSVALESLDGRPFSSIDDEGPRARDAALGRLRGLFSVPAEEDSGRVGFPAPEDPVLARPLFDLCLDRCGDPGWSPSHKRLVDGAVQCLSGALQQDGTCARPETFAAQERLLLDGSSRKQVKLPTGVLGLAACGAAETWERHLGVPTTPEPGSWLQTRRARFEESPPAASAPDPLELPCLKEPPTCRRELERDQDLSDLSLAELVGRRCKAGDEVLELVLRGTVSLSGRPFTVSQDALPPAMKTVRLLGAPGASAQILVSPPRCGFGPASPCAEAQPALLIRGDLEVELANLSLLPRPPPSPPAARAGAPAPPPQARVGLQAEGGARERLILRVHDVDIGDRVGGQPPFYEGLRFSRGTLVLHDTNVRAFTGAISAERARVSVTSWPLLQQHELASLAQTGLSARDLADLDGRPLSGRVDPFRALALRTRAQVFLAGMAVRGPVNVHWAAEPDDAREEGLLSLRTRFTNGSGLFPLESVTLSVQGRGLLRFLLPEIDGVANVLDCRSQPLPGAAETPPRVELFLPKFGGEIRFGPRQGICDFNTNALPTPTHPQEAVP